MREAIFLILLATASPCFAETSAETNEPSCEILELLDRWEQATAHIKTLNSEFKKIEYNDVFDVEKRWTGRFSSSRLPNWVAWITTRHGSHNESQPKKKCRRSALHAQKRGS